MSTRSSRHSRTNRERIDDTATEEKQPLSTVRRRDDEDHGPTKSKVTDTDKSTIDDGATGRRALKRPRECLDETKDAKIADKDELKASSTDPVSSRRSSKRGRAGAEDDDAMAEKREVKTEANGARPLGVARRQSRVKDEIEASHDGDEPKNGVLKSAASSLEPDRKRSRRSRAEEDEAVVDGAKEPKEKAEAGLKDLKAEAGKESGADNDDGAPDESSKARKPRSRPSKSPSASARVPNRSVEPLSAHHNNGAAPNDQDDVAASQPDINPELPVERADKNSGDAKNITDTSVSEPAATDGRAEDEVLDDEALKHIDDAAGRRAVVGVEGDKQGNSGLLGEGCSVAANQQLFVLNGKKLSAADCQTKFGCSIDAVKACPEFFLGRANKTADRFNEIKACLEQRWDASKPDHIGKADATQDCQLCDPHAVGRVFNFLERSGIINTGPKPSSGSENELHAESIDVNTNGTANDMLHDDDDDNDDDDDDDEDETGGEGGEGDADDDDSKEPEVAGEDAEADTAEEDDEEEGRGDDTRRTRRQDEDEDEQQGKKQGDQERKDNKNKDVEQKERSDKDEKAKGLLQRKRNVVSRSEVGSMSNKDDQDVLYPGGLLCMMMPPTQMNNMAKCLRSLRAMRQQYHVRPKLLTPSTAAERRAKREIDFGVLQTNVLRKYQHFHSLSISRKAPKEELVALISRHFRQQRAAAEHSTLKAFIAKKNSRYS